MRKTMYTLAGAFALLSVLGGCAAAGQQAQQADYRKLAQSEPVALTAEEAAVYRETNAYRQAQGLAPLAADARLVAIARARSKDMARRSYFAHATPEGSDVFQLLRAREVRYQAAGENLARNNYPSPETAGVAMQGWIKSPGHRANLLHPAFGHIGVGMAVAKDGKVYFTQVFTD